MVRIIIVQNTFKDTMSSVGKNWNVSGCLIVQQGILTCLEHIGKLKAKEIIVQFVKLEMCVKMIS